MRPHTWLPALAGLASLVLAEDGLDGWLRYERLPACRLQGRLDGFPTTIATLNATDGSPIETAGTELQKGISGILGLDLDLQDGAGEEGESSKIVVSTVNAYEAEFGSLPSEAEDLIADGFYLSITEDEGVLILGFNERGALYGAFEYLSRLGQANFKEVAYATNPDGQYCLLHTSF